MCTATGPKLWARVIDSRYERNLDNLRTLCSACNAKVTRNEFYLRTGRSLGRVWRQRTREKLQMAEFENAVAAFNQSWQWDIGSQATSRKFRAFNRVNRYKRIVETKPVAKP